MLDILMLKGLGSLQHTLFKFLELAKEGGARGTKSVLLTCSVEGCEPGEISIRCLSGRSIGS
jgi:hypothetical protein